MELGVSDKIGRPLIVTPLLTSSSRTLSIGSSALQLSGPSPETSMTMRDAFTQIAEELGHQYTIAYRPLNKKHDGKWRALEVKVERDDLTVRTRKGYRAPKK